jgi:uncharacterized protein YlxW (UPF0749 family)
MSGDPRPSRGPGPGPDDTPRSAPAAPPDPQPATSAAPAGSSAAAGEAPPAGPSTAAEEAPPADKGPPPDGTPPDGDGGEPRPRRRRDPLAAVLIGVLTLLLGFAIAVQVRSTGADEVYASAREEDLVRILDELDAREDRLRAQIAEQRAALGELNNTDSRSAAALEEARQRAEALGILNGTVAAEGPGLTMTVQDPEGSVRVADLLDAIQELRGAGAETMQIDDVRIGVSTAVTGEPGALSIDGQPIASPYEVLVIGSPQDLQTAMNIPGGVVDRIGRQGGSVDIVPTDRVVVDALRPLETPEYAAPGRGGD